jgi:Skp family chaperone for outer membrane proteins
MAIRSVRWSTGLALCMAIGALGVGGVGAGMAYSAVARRAAPPAAVVATFDLERVFNSLEERTARQMEFKTYADSLQKELTDLEGKLKDEQSKVDALPEGPDKTKARAAFVEMRLNAEVKKKVAEALLEQRGGQTFVDLYRKINAGVATLAKQNNYTIVLSSDEKAVIPDGASSQDIQRVMQLRRLYYVAPGHDVTDDLITLLNNEFKAGGKPG